MRRIIDPAAFDLLVLVIGWIVYLGRCAWLEIHSGVTAGSPLPGQILGLFFIALAVSTWLVGLWHPASVFLSIAIVCHGVSTAVKSKAEQMARDSGQ